MLRRALTAAFALLFAFPSFASDLACGAPARVLASLRMLDYELADFTNADAVTRANKAIARLIGKPPDPMPDRFVLYRDKGMPMLVIGVRGLLCQAQPLSEDFTALLLEALQPQTTDGAF